MVFKDDCLVYDLACSTGETVNQLLKLKISTKFSIVGIDNSKKMLDLARKKFQKIKKKIKAKFILQDLNKIKLKRSNLILAILVFMFFNFKQRKILLKKYTIL